MEHCTAPEIVAHLLNRINSVVKWNKLSEALKFQRHPELAEFCCNRIVQTL